jgi:DNA-binding beta-propeller fold protein YncE
MAYDGANVWVTNGLSNTVTKLNFGGASCKVLGTFATGTYPSQIVFDGTYLWVTDNTGNTVTKLSKNGI